ncbi:spore coat protein U domain-containing protein [Salinisphaera sp. USBA-960]|nr:spore coat protein U domain-containing protein [Salifodinibacter halophilus]
MKRQTLVMLLFGCAGLWSMPAAPAIDCSVDSNDLIFSAYDASTGNKDSTGRATFSCHNTQSPTTINYDIAVRTANGDSYQNRWLNRGSASDKLNYNVYKTSARNNIWGYGPLRKSGSMPIEEDASKTFTLYGRIFGGQNVGVGSYEDTITVIISLKN